MTQHPNPSVFLDPSGKRWRTIQRASLAVGLLTTLFGLGIIISFLIPPVLPNLQDARAQVRAAGQTARPKTTRREREKTTAQRRLETALSQYMHPPAMRPSQLPVTLNRKVETAVSRRPVSMNSDRPGIVAGFFVNWDDNSRTSLNAHIRDLDWVVGEWFFISPNGTRFDDRTDARALYMVEQLEPKDRPKLMAMVSNFDRGTQKFHADALRKLMATSQSREAAAVQLVNACIKYGFAGISLDFEEVPDDLVPSVLAFSRILRAGLAPGGRVLSTAVPVSTDEETARQLAATNDYLFLMLYDEHYGRGDPGPVASQRWFESRLDQFLKWIPPGKAIVTLGAYGYEWNDADNKVNGSTVTFQDVMRLSKEHNATVRFDSTMLNPFVTWSDSDGTDHVSWFLDGVTAWNQSKASVQRKVAGAAVWRLGSEDPSIWGAISNDIARSHPSMLAEIPAGYDPEILGDGELLRLASRPVIGRRTLAASPRTGLIEHESVLAFPAPWRVQRFGGEDTTKVAITFDDGPDPRYTAAILDTLKSRNAKATFFVVGRQVDLYPALLRRILREGHEIGSHTYTHPNLALTSPFLAKLELVASGRLIESILNRRTALFRPPYFGDAEPTTADELIPVGIATDLGYLTVGVHIDSEDWRLTNPQAVYDTTMLRLDKGNVLLLHDSGGDRNATVAILGTLIDSMRAHGREPILVSELAGITRDEAMPPLATHTTLERVVEVVAFTTIGLMDWGIYWIFLIAVVLGLIRLVFVFGLAILQRRQALREQAVVDASLPFAPPVAIIVPAYNEGMVIARTVQSLLNQEYEGDLRIIVVDDGSPDDTFALARNGFVDDSRVEVHTKPNAGKAAALNFGIARATTDIIICLDADTLFEPVTVRELVQPFRNPNVGAVAGNAKVGNRINTVTRWQALEYITSQNLDRRAFSMLNCITVIPGAVGAWRRSAVLDAGGFTSDTLAEDQDLTIRIRRTGLTIAYAERAIAWTEAPATLSALSRQRFRWSFGTLQCAWKHRDTLLRPKYGSLGLVAMPNTWVFQLLLMALSPLSDLLFLYALVSVWLTWTDHGASYALSDLENLLAFYAIFLLTDWLGAFIAFLMEPDEQRSLSWLIVIQRFVYRQIMYSVVLRSFFAAIQGRVVGWGSLERKATAEIGV
ncbi:MAG: glycosyltransferase [Gemmatimonadetes bacterium]|nr:glycosyltransferase [Gemmatimonadota bacterium]